MKGDRLISLNAAIEAVHKNYDVILDFTSDGQTISSSTADILSKLPSAQLERKKGRWNDIDAETYTWKIRCDQCGHERSMLSTGQTYPRFCENCGADMRGDDHEG